MKLISFHADRSGVTSIEYAIIASLIAVVIISPTTLLGQNVSGTFSTIATIFTGPATTAAPHAPLSTKN
jgi:pilus assembly protein Flp/PilA